MGCLPPSQVIDDQAHALLIVQDDGFRFTRVNDQSKSSDHSPVRRRHFGEPGGTRAKLLNHRRRCDDGIEQCRQKIQPPDALKADQTGAIEDGGNPHHAISAASSGSLFAAASE